MSSEGSASRRKGASAGRNAPPTPLRRTAWPPALKARLEKAGIRTARLGKKKTKIVSMNKRSQ